MKAALRLLLAPYRFSVDRLFRMGEVGGAHWFTDPNTLYRRRNRLTYTRDFSNAAWARTRILSVTADADGVGDLVVPDATPSTHAINQQSAVTVGATTTYVVRAKPGGYDFVILSLGSSSLAYFDLSAGTVGTTSNAISTSIAAAADAPGYYDCTLVGIPNSANCFIYVAQTDGVVAFAGDGTSGVYLARAQLEIYTTTPTEYQDVPTTWAQAYLAAVGAENIFAWTDSAGTTPVTAVGDTIGLSVRRAGTLNLSQATGTARPTLSARVNMLLASEDFSSASWTKSRATVTANAATAPNGTLTADKIVEDTATNTHRAYQATTKPSAVASSWVFSVSLKAAERGFATVKLSDNSESDQGAVGINLSTGAVSAFVGTFTNMSVTVVDEGNGWWRVKFTATCDTDSQVVAWVQVANALGTSTSYTGDGLSGIYAWGADLRTADDAAKNIPAYQRVGATAADHDTDGFPHGQYTDGTDDNQTTTTGGGGTTGFFYCGAITVSGGAGTARTIWSDTGTNTGYRVRINSSNKLELAAGNGSSYTTVESNETITAPGTYILSAWDDGGVLAVQVNNFAPATTTRPTVSAGTAAITVYKDNGAASNYLNGRDYGSVYRQSYIGESQHARLKRWLADRARITL